MEELISYECHTSVVLIIFNRPDETQKTLIAIKKVKPKKLFIIADGARHWISEEKEKVIKCRNLLEIIDWECEVIKIFSDENLGCMRRIVTGLDLVFKMTEKAIILEDDCVPTVNFFRFLEWGLTEFQDDPAIGMISGSNLISHKFNTKSRNGFSSLINIWGWATWKSIWVRHNPFLTLLEIKRTIPKISKTMNYNWWQSIYWREVFTYAVYSGSTWDSQLQFSFFKMNLLSVYPCKNLVFNIGFNGNGTHTNIKAPKYIAKNKPDEIHDIFQISPSLTKKIDTKRDLLIAQEIWHFNIITAIRLKVVNFFRLIS